MKEKDWVGINKYGRGYKEDQYYEMEGNDKRQRMMEENCKPNQGPTKSLELLYISETK